MRIHFIAIGGAAMHNLAMAVASKPGYVVTGSDDEILTLHGRICVKQDCFRKRWDGTPR